VSESQKKSLYLYLHEVTERDLEPQDDSWTPRALVDMEVTGLKFISLLWLVLLDK
jgi:hypothetical protein